MGIFDSVIPMDGVMNTEAGPFQMESKKLGMWLFLISDALTFGALFISYAYLRLASPNWPTPFASVIKPTLMTLLLLSSSITVTFAVASMKQGNRRSTARWLAATILCGVGFLILHILEWHHFWMIEKVTLSSNPWKVPLFGATFYAITGLHMLHVVCGVLYLLVMTIAVRRGKYSAEEVETCGLYWHFVDLVWIFIFPLVYLTQVKA